MRATEALRKIMKETGWTQARMAKELGLKGQQVISSRLAMKNISVDTAMEMLDKMGYEIVFQPVSGGQRKKGAYVIDGTDDAP